MIRVLVVGKLKARWAQLADEDFRRRLTRFGYTDTDEARPLIRLACKAQASGNVSVVVPPSTSLLPSTEASTGV